MLEHYLLYVVYDAAKEKIYSVLKLFFLFCLSWSNRQDSFCYTIIFFMLFMMEEEKKLILLKHYFFYVVCDGAREKTPSVITLFFLCCL